MMMMMMMSFHRSNKLVPRVVNCSVLVVVVASCCGSDGDGDSHGGEGGAIDSAVRQVSNCIEDEIRKIKILGPLSKRSECGIIRKIGISGLGGEKVANALKDMPMVISKCSVVLCISVSRHHSIEEVRQNIATQTGRLRSRKTDHTSEGSLDQYLPDNFLLLVDCIDGQIDLHDVKIPDCGFLVLTTQSQKVREIMDLDLEIRMEDHLLPWKLFCSNVGPSLVHSSSVIEQMAPQLVKECHGHLLAIVLLARALKGVTDIGVWELALNQLVVSQSPHQQENGMSQVMFPVLKFVWDLKDGCELLMELPPHIRALENLEEFDLEGTEIMYLPKEIGKLINLRRFKVSFCQHANRCKETKQMDTTITTGVLSKLNKLRERSIDVNRDDEWWDADVKLSVGNIPIFRYLKYLGIHYMWNLQSIWKGPIDEGCLSNLMVLALHTCPNLTTIFTPNLLGNLRQLEELIVEDCCKIKSLVSQESSNLKHGYVLQSLKSILLLELPELVSISDVTSISPMLKSLIVYNCPKLETHYVNKAPAIKDLKIRGEKEWWESLKWHESESSSSVWITFEELGRGEDLMDELARHIYSHCIFNS
ncbi:putative disease resistance protein [Camellia lanceoleosa]|uniref:Disease resistance protein n=1 Tax=Camellia lanceoleosa TaxID=1840588 RepID=A0ACC0IR82_9ERIC|nr:putative disease resistance protein [Camellia lanceoleosa]